MQRLDPQPHSASRACGADTPRFRPRPSVAPHRYRDRARPADQHQAAARRVPRLHRSPADCRRCAPDARLRLQPEKIRLGIRLETRRPGIANHARAFLQRQPLRRVRATARSSRSLCRTQASTHSRRVACFGRDLVETQPLNHFEQAPAFARRPVSGSRRTPACFRQHQQFRKMLDARAPFPARRPS